MSRSITIHDCAPGHRKNLTLPIIFFTTLLLVFSFDARADTGGDRPKSIPELQAAVEKVLKETKTPGTGIAIVSRDQAEWVAGIGKADVAANLPVTADTLFRLGSISKTFVAVAALQLQEEGKLKLTDTVRQWAPDVTFVNPWEPSDPVRLVHLLEHTSGFDDMHFREYALDDPKPMSLKDALAYGASSRVCRWPPGTRMSYCSSGPALLAAVIEKVSGERFEDYVQEHIFVPLHMGTASYFYTPTVQQRLAKLYYRDGVTPHPYWHIALRPTAGLNASARDMANYIRFYLQRGSLDGTLALQPASIERMETTGTMPSAKLGDMLNYGLSDYPIPEGAFVFRGHGGAVIGGLARMAYLPSQGRGYAFMINSGNFKTALRIEELIRHYLTNSLAPPALPPIAAVPAALKEHYQGYYQIISPQMQWSSGFDHLLSVTKLTFTTDGLSTGTYGFVLKKQWVPLSERLFRQANESVAQVALLPDAEGKILMQYGWTVFEKVPAWRAWAQLIGMIVVSVLVLSSLLMAPVWVFKKLFCKNYNPGPLSVRFWPLASAALLVVFDLLLVYGFRGVLVYSCFDDFNLGTRNFLTVSIMLASIAFPLAAGMGLYCAYRRRNTPMKRRVYWYCILVATAVVASAIYYGYWSLIGLRLWV
jgi:CubicO group peptidase (beta-lactamase class C family)